MNDCWRFLRRLDAFIELRECRVNLLDAGLFLLAHIRIAATADGVVELLLVHGELVTSLYTKALSRKPTTAESKLARELLGPSLQKDQVEDLLWSLAMLPEFQLIY